MNKDQRNRLLKKQKDMQKKQKNNGNLTVQQLAGFVQEQLDSDRARINQMESHLLTLDKGVQRLSREIMGEIQQIKTRQEEIESTLKDILDILLPEEEESK